MKNIRWYGYWLMDFLKGSPVRKYLNEIKRDYTEGTSKQCTEEKIRKLIKHAILTTQYYRNINKDIDINDLPIMNKNIYNANYSQFLSEEYCDAKSNRIMYTSGSTGTPFAMVQNKDKINHNTAASIFLCSLMGYFIGTKMGFPRVWVEANKKTKMQSFVENMLMIDITQMNDEKMAAILNTIRKQRIKILFGYASAFIEMAKYLARNPDETERIRLKSVMTTSEVLPSSIRDELSQLLKCPVYSVYTNEENGIMAVQDSSGPNYYFDSASYFLEILKLDSDLQAEEGELGRIVLTDLYNYAFPLIRYDTGDVAVYRSSSDGDKYKILLHELYGRKSDIVFDSSGNQISPHAITNNMWGITGIKQWQFVQIAKKEYRIILNLISPDFNTEEIIRRILPIVGTDSRIDFSYVDEIPVLDSGKRRTIENRYN